MLVCLMLQEKVTASKDLLLLSVHIGDRQEDSTSHDIGSRGSNTSVEKVERSRKRPFCRNMLYQHFANPAQGQ
jgi:hypothetical protein